MRNKSPIAGFALLGAMSIGNAVLGAPSASECRVDGGPTACVRFDNLDDPPEENTDFKITFDGAGLPTIELLTGRTTGAR